MKKLLPFVFTAALASCNDNVIKVGGDTGEPTDPQANCDFVEIDLGPETSFDQPQYIDALPALSERIVCGTMSNTFDGPLVIDYDLYLFPLATFEEQVLVNFAVETDDTHTPLLEVFVSADDMEEPQLVGSFVGLEGIVAVLDWPIGVTGEVKTDLYVRVSAYSQFPNSSADYVLKYW
jgi:hypothetical protein